MTGMGWATEVVGWVGQLFTVVEPDELPDPVDPDEAPDEASDALPDVSPELFPDVLPDVEETPEEGEEAPLEAPSGPNPSPWIPGDDDPLLPQPLAIPRANEPMQSALERFTWRLYPNRRLVELARALRERRVDRS
jgi:hypothetical protein